MKPVSDNRTFVPPLASTASRKISRRSKARVYTALTVSLPADKCRPRIIYCESKLERNCLLLWLAKKDVFDVREQPSAVSFKDGSGVVRKHTFDFLITLKNKKKYAIVVKPSNNANKDKFKSDINCLSQQLPKSFADQLVLFTDRSYRNEEAVNAERLFKLKTHITSDDHLAIKCAISGQAGFKTVRAILASAGNPNGGFGAVLHAVFEGRLELIRSQIITLHSLVKPVEVQNAI